MENVLAPEELLAVEAEVNRLIDQTGAEVATAGWLPGADWRDTPFWPIYDKAARRNQETAAKMFGLLVWRTFANRSEAWASGRYQKDGKDIVSRTYFRVQRPPRG